MIIMTILTYTYAKFITRNILIPSQPEGSSSKAYAHQLEDGERSRVPLIIVTTHKHINNFSRLSLELGFMMPDFRNLFTRVCAFRPKTP